MARTPRRSFLDGPIARVLAAVIFLGCIAALAYLERDRFWPAASNATAADDPFRRCFAERAGQINQMLTDGLIQPAQAELFKTRSHVPNRDAKPGRRIAC